MTHCHDYIYRAGKGATVEYRCSKCGQRVYGSVRCQAMSILRRAWGAMWDISYRIDGMVTTPIVYAALKRWPILPGLCFYTRRVFRLWRWVKTRPAVVRLKFLCQCGKRLVVGR